MFGTGYRMSFHGSASKTEHFRSVNTSLHHDGAETPPVTIYCQDCGDLWRLCISRVRFHGVQIRHRFVYVYTCRCWSSGQALMKGAVCSVETSVPTTRRYNLKDQSQHLHLCENLDLLHMFSCY